VDKAPGWKADDRGGFIWEKTVNTNLFGIPGVAVVINTRIQVCVSLSIQMYAIHPPTRAPPDATCDISTQNPHFDSTRLRAQKLNTLRIVKDSPTVLSEIIQ
jgi:hypothetical protein